MDEKVAVLSALQLTGSNRVPSFPKSSTCSAASSVCCASFILTGHARELCAHLFVFLLRFILCLYLEAPHRSSTPVTQGQQSCPAKEKGSNLVIKHELESFFCTINDIFSRGDKHLFSNVLYFGENRKRNFSHYILLLFHCSEADLLDLRPSG